MLQGAIDTRHTVACKQRNYPSTCTILYRIITTKMCKHTLYISGHMNGNYLRHTNMDDEDIIRRSKAIWVNRCVSLYTFIVIAIVVFIIRRAFTPRIGKKCIILLMSFTPGSAGLASPLDRHQNLVTYPRRAEPCTHPAGARRTETVTMVCLMWRWLRCRVAESIS